MAVSCSGQSAWVPTALLQTYVQTEARPLSQGHSLRSFALINNVTSSCHLSNTSFPSLDPGKATRAKVTVTRAAAMTSLPLIRACNHQASREWASGAATCVRLLFTEPSRRQVTNHPCLQLAGALWLRKAGNSVKIE